MRLAQYQSAAAATAQPAAYQYDYLVPMIVGEVGELFGQRAKSVWHGWTREKLQAELVSEYGDIAWGTAILLKMEGVEFFRAQLRQGPATTVWGNEPSPWQPLANKAANLFHFYTQEETHQYIRGEAQQMWLTLESSCKAVTGTDFNTVLERNLLKLQGRVARGTLVGSGDHR